MLFSSLNFKYILATDAASHTQKNYYILIKPSAWSAIEGCERVRN